VGAIIFLPFFAIVAIGVILVFIALRNIKKTNQNASKRYRSNYTVQPTRGPRYVPGQFSNQMELDMRLPYRCFKQLYPETRWTYQEYKRMQMQTAFRHSYSSQNNKRMVR
jgi:hypothetical protein